MNNEMLKDPEGSGVSRIYVIIPTIVLGLGKERKTAVTIS
jgi:hypothetical protein